VIWERNDANYIRSREYTDFIQLANSVCSRGHTEYFQASFSPTQAKDVHRMARNGQGRGGDILRTRDVLGVELRVRPHVTQGDIGDLLNVIMTCYATTMQPLCGDPVCRHSKS
jgi:hypothetical protein